MADKTLKPLTKSRFKIGHECPRKLFYKNRPEYQDTSLNDEFLNALAEGGFQVGALANLVYSPGQMVDAKDYVSSLEKTLALLSENESVTVFEAALGNHAQFVRVDILRKAANSYDLIETKAKSIESIEGGYKFWDARRKEPTLIAKWEPYLIDVAYQTWVARRFLPKTNGQPPSVTPYLLLADKSASASVENSAIFPNSSIDFFEHSCTTATSLFSDRKRSIFLEKLIAQFQVAKIIDARQISFDSWA